MRPFAELLTEYMNRINISDAELARSIRVRRQTIFRWRQGIVKKPRHRDDVLQCAQALGLTRGERDALLKAAGFQPAKGSFEAPPPFPNSAPSKTDYPFVARQTELAQLNAFLEYVLAGQGQVVFIAGDAGSGKTALVQEFARRAQETHADLVIAGGNCSAYTGVGDPYLPFREVLELLTGDFETDWAVTTIGREYIHRVWALIPQVIQALVNVGPELIDVFVSGEALLKHATVAAPSNAGLLATLKALVARNKAGAKRANLEQRNLFEQYTHVMQSLARQKSLLLVLDDLQWADAGSISLLFHLGHHLNHSRVLIIGIYRSADLAVSNQGKPHSLKSVVHEFQRRFGDNQIDLRKAKGREFIEQFLDTEPNRLTEAFRGALYRHTYGNPLFTIEMLRGMQERGDLIRDAEERWIEGPSVDWSTLPARVEGMIGERIGRLPLNLQELLKIASVEGETFTAEVMAHVQGADEEETVKRFSRELDKQLHLVAGHSNLRIGTQRLSQYRFRHILFQKYLYDSVGEAERAYLHERVGNALEVLYKDQTDEIAVQLARHFQEAGILKKAIDYLLQAGQRALRLSANEEAILHLTRGLELLESLPDTPERIQQELNFQVTLGPALMTSKGYAAPEVKETFTRARELLHHAEDTPQVLPVLQGMCIFYLVRQELHTALDLAKRVHRLTQSVQDPVSRLGGHAVMGGPLQHLGELAAAREHLEQVTALYDPQQHHSLTFLFGYDPGVNSLSYLAYLLWLLGYPDQALQRSRKALDLAQQLDHPYSLAWALDMDAVLRHLRREVGEVRKQAAAAIALSNEHGFAPWQAHGAIMRGWALAEQGQVEEGIGHIDQGLAAWQATGARLARTYYLGLLAEAYGKAGQADQGLTVLAKALDVVAETDERWYEAELYRLKGKLLLAQSDAVAAEASFHKAIEVARRQQAKSLELRATMSLCRLWQKQGKREEAHPMLAEIYGWFTEGFDTPDLQEAQELLTQLSV